MKKFFSIIVTLVSVAFFSSTVLACPVGEPCSTGGQYLESGGYGEGWGHSSTWGAGYNAGDGNVIARENVTDGYSRTEVTNDFTSSNCVDGCEGFNTHTTGFSGAGQFSSTLLVTDGNYAEGGSESTSDTMVGGATGAYRSHFMAP